MSIFQMQYCDTLPVYDIIFRVILKLRYVSSTGVGTCPLFAFMLRRIRCLSNHVTEKVKELALPIIEEAGVELADIEYKKEGQDWFLRVFLDGKDKPIDIDACSFVSERLSKLLDEEDPIPNSYFLEVSSRGAERQLKNEIDFLEAIGKNIHITTYEAIEGKKTFKGILVNHESDYLLFEENGKEMKISLKKIASVRLDVSF